MSVFGFGNSYYARGQQDGIQPNPQTSPSFGGVSGTPFQDPLAPQPSWETFGQTPQRFQGMDITRSQQMPGMAPFNQNLPGFNVASEAKSPWMSQEYGSGGRTPSLMDSNGILNPMAVPAKRTDQSWSSYTWANPLQVSFGSYANQVLPGSDPNQRRTGGLLPSSRYLDEYGQFLDTPKPGKYEAPLNTQSFAALNAGLSNLTPEQINYLDRHAEEVSKVFSSASQNYANAFGNQAYAGGKGRVGEISPYVRPEYSLTTGQLGGGVTPTGGLFATEGVNRKDWSLDKANQYLGGIYSTIYDQMAAAGVL